MLARVMRNELYPVSRTLFGLGVILYKNEYAFAFVYHLAPPPKSPSPLGRGLLGWLGRPGSPALPRTTRGNP